MSQKRLWKPDALAKRSQLPLLPRSRVGLPFHLSCSKAFAKITASRAANKITASAKVATHYTCYTLIPF